VKKRLLVKNPKPGNRNIDLKNKKFGSLLVKSFHSLIKYGNKLWLCKCNCGNELLVITSYLTSKNTTLCSLCNKKLGKDI